MRIVPRGELRAEILDAETMQPLPGLSAGECLPLNGDHLRGKLRWKDSPRLVNEKAVRLHFILRRAKAVCFLVGMKGKAQFSAFDQSERITAAALCPGAPVTSPPGCVPAPQR